MPNAIIATLLVGGAMIAPAPVTAQSIAATRGITVKPIIDARLRYEHVEQEGLARDADAVTARLRAGVELSSGRWSLLAEGETTLAISKRYNNGLNGRTQFPIVADPENIELNRFQIQYRGLPGAVVTAGRQRINLDDQRFVGSSGWRQNEQTFDAVRFEYGDAKSVRADLTYAWSVRSIWGIDGRDARPEAIGGNNVFATISHPTVLGTLSGFAFFVDQDEPRVQGFRLSSQTYGIRLAGSRKLSSAAKLNYVLSYASQSDHHRNPNSYRADYWLVDLGIEFGAAKLGIGHERLGAGKGLPLTSFQTPLATLHKFQGWADKFLTTPPDGLRDLYASGGYGWKSVAGFDAINAAVIYHRFDSDRLNIKYGSEWDAAISAKRGRWTATAKLADYRANHFSTDTHKIWLEFDWAY